MFFKDKQIEKKQCIIFKYNGFFALDFFFRLPEYGQFINADIFSFFFFCRGKNGNYNTTQEKPFDLFIFPLIFVTFYWYVIRIIIYIYIYYIRPYRIY